MDILNSTNKENLSKLIEWKGLSTVGLIFAFLFGGLVEIGINVLFVKFILKSEIKRPINSMILLDQVKTLTPLYFFNTFIMIFFIQGVRFWCVLFLLCYTTLAFFTSTAPAEFVGDKGCQLFQQVTVIFILHQIVASKKDFF